MYRNNKYRSTKYFYVSKSNLLRFLYNTLYSNLVELTVKNVKKNYKMFFILINILIVMIDKVWHTLSIHRYMHIYECVWVHSCTYA